MKYFQNRQASFGCSEFQWVNNAYPSYFISYYLDLRLISFYSERSLKSAGKKCELKSNQQLYLLIFADSYLIPCNFYHKNLTNPNMILYTVLILRIENNALYK